MLLDPDMLGIRIREIKRAEQNSNSGFEIKQLEIHWEIDSQYVSCRKYSPSRQETKGSKPTPSDDAESNETPTSDSSEDKDKTGTEHGKKLSRVTYDTPNQESEFYQAGKPKDWWTGHDITHYKELGRRENNEYKSPYSVFKSATKNDCQNV